MTPLALAQFSGSTQLSVTRSDALVPSPRLGRCDQQPTQATPAWISGTNQLLMSLFGSSLRHRWPLLCCRWLAAQPTLQFRRIRREQTLHVKAAVAGEVGSNDFLKVMQGYGGYPH